IVGTPAYMAPERLAAHPYDGRSDIYSLAVMMYELLCGRQPFAEHAQAFASLVVAHLQYPPPPVRKFAEYVPEAVEALVLCGLSKKPVDRPTAQEFADQIAQILNILPEESDQLPHSARSADQNREIAALPTAEFTTTNLVETQNLPSTRTNPE
ncbi:MAG TPA: protein kinase, partial [Acidobacteriota bacterium]|nr:protein kinase [Acidobacteriota bacterium]